MPGRQRKAVPQTHRVGFFEMLQNVLIASINKGQFPLACVCLIVMVMALRMPPQDATDLITRILDLLQNGQLTGWVLAAGMLGTWVSHVRIQRARFMAELARVSEERNKAQNQALGGNVRSSKESSWNT